MEQNQMDYYISKMEMAFKKLREAKDMELEANKMLNEIKMDNMHKKSLQDSLAAMQVKNPEIKTEISKEEYMAMRRKDQNYRFRIKEADDGNY